MADIPYNITHYDKLWKQLNSTPTIKQPSCLIDFANMQIKSLKYVLKTYYITANGP